MKKRVIDFIRTYWIVIWLATAIFTLASITTYAAYIRTQNVKRVISTMGGAGNRFSSNRLDELETDNSARVFRLIPVPETVPSGGIDRSLTICNYPQGYEASFYETTIYYNLEVELTDNQSAVPVFDDEATALLNYYIVDSSGTTHYFEKDSGNGRFFLTISDQELKGKKSSTDTYTIHFPDVDTGVYMSVFAKPMIADGSSRIPTDDLKSIGAMISAVSVDQSQDTNWSGSLVEPRVTGKMVSDYDAFNYVISGSGAGTITLKWKAEMLEINSHYADNEGISASIVGPDSDGYNSLTYSVTADQAKNRYSFQMFKSKNSNWSSITSFASIANDENDNNPLILFDFSATTTP